MKEEISIKALKNSVAKLPENFEMAVWQKITGRTWSTMVPWQNMAKPDESLALLWKGLPWAVACMALFVGVELGTLRGMDHDSNAKESMSALYTNMVNPADDNPYL